MRVLYFLALVLLLVEAKPKESAENEVENEVTDQEPFDYPAQDPCHDHYCSIGKMCELNEEDKPICVCAHACPKETVDRAKVCSTTNVTFDSECELNRQKCLCQKHQDGCENPEYRHTHMDYFGPCKEMQPCTDEEMEDFPIRMREWLFLVMKEMASRDELTKPAKKLARKAKKQPKHWVLPVIWKFCDLDRTHDFYVDKEELMPITAPLKPMEHCTGPFIEKCDSNNDGQIDLNEWNICLGLEDEDQIEEVEQLCKDIHNHRAG